MGCGSMRRRGKACESGCQVADISQEVQLLGNNPRKYLEYLTVELLMRCQPPDTQIHMPSLLLQNFPTPHQTLQTHPPALTHTNLLQNLEIWHHPTLDYMLQHSPTLPKYGNKYKSSPSHPTSDLPYIRPTPHQPTLDLPYIALHQTYPMSDLRYGALHQTCPTPVTYPTPTYTYSTPSSLSICKLSLAMTPSAPLLNPQVHERFLLRMVPHSILVSSPPFFIVEGLFTMHSDVV